MSDLATLAGVSVTTVSHVLNNTRFVSEAARKSVLDAVAQTAYTPNILARSMTTATTSTIGLAAPALSKVALGELVHGIEAEVRARDLGLLFTDTEDAHGPELAAVQALHARRVDGIIIAPSSTSPPAVDYLHSHGIPTVVVDRFTKGGFDQIGTENTKSTRKLTEHLIIEGGHKRIALIDAMPELSTTVERRKGYRQALRHHNLTIDTNLVRSSYEDPTRYLPILKELLEIREPPTAIVSGNSSTTLGIMRAAGELGVVVPRDLALVGFDDFEWADVFHPRLTVIRQRMDEIGARAVALLLQRIANPDAPVRTTRVGTEFVHRDSCGCNAARD